MSIRKIPFSQTQKIPFHKPRIFLLNTHNKQSFHKPTNLEYPFLTQMENEFFKIFKNPKEINKPKIGFRSSRIQSQDRESEMRK